MENNSAKAVKSVKVYATTSCPYCKLEKAYLEEKGIKFEYLLVDQNQAAAEEMIMKTRQLGVPVTEVVFSEGQPDYIIGFDQSKLEQVLV